MSSLAQPKTLPLTASVFPIKRAEELLGTLPGVISARIVAGPAGAVDEIHILASSEVAPKQTVRNVESALLAHLGMRVDHRKISVATSVGPTPERPRADAPTLTSESRLPAIEADRRRLYFEDVEVRRSRTKGVLCKVTLKKGAFTFSGEAEGVDGERTRLELAARAALSAIAQERGTEASISLEGCKVLDAFEREFVFVGVMVRVGRETALLTGSCEIKDSPETSSVLAVLDATNRWITMANR